MGTIQTRAHTKALFKKNLCYRSMEAEESQMAVSWGDKTTSVYAARCQEK